MNYGEVYFVIVSIANLVIATFLLLISFYALSILSDIKRLSKIAKKEAEIIAKGFEKGATIVGSELGNEATGFVKTVFGLLLSNFAPKKPRTTKVKPKGI